MKKIITAITAIILAFGVSSEMLASTTNRSICQGDSVLFMGQYYSQSGTYTNLSDTLVLAVNPLPTPILSLVGSICDGNAGNDTLIFEFSDTATAITIKFNDSVIYSFAYSFPSGHSYAYPGNLGVGTYSLIATNQAGCIDSGFITINAPCIDTNVTHRSICQGDAVLFNNQWITQAGIYTSGSDTLILAVDSIPIINSLTQNGSLCQGDTLTAAISGAVSVQWSLNGNVLSTMTDTVTVAGGNGNGSAANQLNYPHSIFIDNGGNLYVVDYMNNRVQKFLPGSTNGITVAANGLHQPHGVFVDNSGNIYVSDFLSRVQKFPAGSNSITAGVIVAGGNGNGNAANQLYAPREIFVDNSDNLYVADYGNGRIQKFPAGSTSATNGITVAYVSTYVSHLFVDNSDNLYVTDYNNNRIQKFSSGNTTGIIVAGDSNGGYGSGANQLKEPYGIFVDNNGNLYVADAGNYRIQKFPAGSTSATNGVTLFSVPGSDVTTLWFNDLFMDTQGSLYISGYGSSSKVLKISDNNTTNSYIATNPGTYTVVAMNVSGCTDSSTITVAPCGTSQQSICQGDSVFFNNQWLKQAGTYTNLADTLLLIVNFCADSGYVWPGDANHDGIANNYDLLPIGIANGLSGPVRATTSIVWQGFQSNDWGLQLLSGTNAKHIDCNGDGLINANDTVAVIQNFGLTHNKDEEHRKPDRAGISGLYIVFEKDTLVGGDTLVASVRLGTPEEPVSDAYGLAFTYNFDATVIDTSTVSFTYTNSWLGGNTDKLSLAKKFNDIGKIKTAVTRFDHVNRSGSGEIAQFRGIITTDNINGKDLSYYTMSHFISNLVATDKDENTIDLNEGVDSAEVGFEPTSIREPRANDANWSLYPNPANHNITIKNTENIEGIVIWNVLGEKVYEVNNVNQESQTISISNLANGIYVARIQTTQGSGEKRFIVAK